MGVFRQPPSDKQINMFFKRSKEKKLSMVWEVEKNNRKSFLVGTAHFFPYSFRSSFSQYIKEARTVIFEGPLDEDSMAKVVKAGYQKENTVHLFDELDKQVIADINNALAPSCRRADSLKLLGLLTPAAENLVYDMTMGMKPWLAFFTIWSHFLKKNGWRYSVDLEAYSVAKEMGKKIVFLETIEEQIKVLENLSHEKMIAFLKKVRQWNAFAQEYVKTYLDGDLEELKSMGLKFPSRHYTVIDRRDQIFYERMLVYLEKGSAIVCVGAPHIRGIAELLRSVGFQTHGLHDP